MHYSAFLDTRLLAAGELTTVITQIKQQFPDREALLVETNSCKRLEINWQGSVEDVLARIDAMPQAEPLSSDLIAPATPKTHIKSKRGRPKLGVVSKEVTLLPRHWEWLSKQSGGASVTLRRLVDQARQENSLEDEIKLRQEQIYNFISFFAEQLPNVEETMRALYRQDRSLFYRSIKNWPTDIRRFCEDRFIAIPTSPKEQGHNNE
ncbi:DUF2239 family protein [Marinomonas agarivorans]|nr:DUF2239 family protein [Marinomonas agarivorans]